MLLLFAWAPWLVGIVTVVFLILCVMMILTVLIQRPQGGGLSGAFGSGAGSGQTAFGAKTGDALTIFTIIVFVLFLGTAIALNYGYRPSAPTVETVGTSQDGSKPAEGTATPTTSDVAPAAPDAQTPAPAAPSAPPTGTPAETPAADPGAAPATPPTPAEQPK